MDPVFRAKFIEIFNEFPCLWNKSCPDFIRFQKEVRFRNERWSQCSRKFQKEGINVSEDDLRKAWNHMRNNFIRYKLPLTVSKNLTKISHEEALHDSLNIVSQRFFKEEPFSQFSETNESIVSFDDEDKKPVEEKKKTSVFFNQPCSSKVKKEDENSTPLARPRLPIPFEIPELTPSPAPIFNTPLTSRKRSFSKVETSNLVDSSQKKSTKDVEVQTEPDYLLKEPSRGKLPSQNELLSLRVTFSYKNTNRTVKIDNTYESFSETQYDKVATGPNLSGTLYDSVAENTLALVRTQETTFGFSDSFVLQDL